MRSCARSRPAAQGGHPPRHRHRLLHQGHRARAAGLLRRRRRADLAAGCLRHRARAQRRHHLRGRRHRAGPGHQHGDGPDRRHRARRAHGKRARALGRHGRVPYGGGTYGSRGTAIGGEAVLPGCPRPARRDPGDRRRAAAGRSRSARHRRRRGRRRGRRRQRMPLSEIGRIGHFQLGELPNSVQPILSHTRRFRLLDDLYIFTNGIHGATWRWTSRPASSSC